MPTSKDCIEEGDACTEEDCTGRFEFGPVQNCTCFLGHAPCWRCENQPLTCTGCGITDHWVYDTPAREAREAARVQKFLAWRQAHPEFIGVYLRRGLARGHRRALALEDDE